MDLRSKIAKRKSSSSIINPIDLFESLSIRSKDVKELWRPQADALREWHEHRAEKDILFMLNTGAGKTLIGLLAAQSLVNETRGKVLYLCATNQLIEQTKAKADEYGIAASTYYSTKWTGDEFERGIGPCITNYQAALNGKSIFNSEEISAVIFDDAHTAFSTVQDQYTLRIDRNKFEDSWNIIMGLFEKYYKSVHRSDRFYDILNEVDNLSVLFVPTFVTYEVATLIRAELVKDGIQDNPETLFVWTHLKDKLRYCAFYFDSSGIYISPPVPPIHEQKIFAKDVRRLYLSATISEGLTFTKTFGRIPNKTITPGGRAGDCERMILQNPQSLKDKEAVEWFKDQAEDEKVLIMVPSKQHLRLWEDFGDVFDANQGHKRLVKFSESNDDKLILKARYDGIDLPGEACRILAINGLPSGISPIEKFFELHLGAKGITDPLIATRLVQIFGRITRGMSDYGVFVLLGRKLNKWINDPRHRKLLPTHIQKQLELGDLLMEDLETDLNLKQKIDMCLLREDDWVESYEEFMANSTGDVKSDKDKELYKIGIAEHNFIKYLWKEDYDETLKAANEVKKLIKNDDESLKAWYTHWLAFAYQLLGEENEAQKYYYEAWKLKLEIGRPLINESIQYDNNINVSEQANLIANRLRESKRKALKQLDELSKDLMEATPHQVEEDLKILGYWLGFDSSRPDNLYDMGPDVLWLSNDQKIAFIIEAKSDKKNTNLKKDEVGQYYQHITWVEKKYPLVEKEYRIVAGPCTDCTNSSSPPEDLWTVSLEQFTNICVQLLEILKSPLDEGLELLYAKRVQSGLDLHGLTWDKIFSQLEKVCISDI